MREPAQGQIIAGKYRIEALIGHGGMGSVWRARHESLDMPVAIKFMGAHAGGDMEARQRFEREARALASLRTPNIVQVLDHGVDGETPYIVMELLEGEDLSSRIIRQKRLALDDTSRILAQVARALRRAHEAGVTHRDLKPSNIFLAHVDGEEIVKVLDFGVAKLAAVGALGDQLTKVGTLLGSPGYMSPEQARGKEVDFRSDLWALAVIVFRAVTGVKPFSGDSIAELVIKLCIDPRPVATRFTPDLPPAIDRFFEKAFAAEQQDRFQSAVEMAAAFAQTIGQPGLELSRAGPSPISAAMAARVDLDAPAATTHGATPGAGGASNTALGFPVPAAVLAPPTSSGMLGPLPRPNAPPAHASVPGAPATTMLLVPMAANAPSAAALREPTPTPASFGGFAPSGAEAGSLAPAAGTTPPLPAEASLRAPPLGIGPASPGWSGGAPQAPGFPTSPTSSSPSFVAPGAVVTNAPYPRGPDAPDAPTPTGMRLHAPGPPVAAPAAPRPAAPPVRVDPKVLFFAAAGAAVLAIVFALAISGLRRRHANASAPQGADDAAPVPTATATASSAATTSESAASATAPIATASDPGATDPTPSAAPPANEPMAGPTVVEAPVNDTPSATQTAPVAPRPSASPRPPASVAPTTKSSGKTAPAPTGSAKKKNPKPNFGY